MCLHSGEGSAPALVRSPLREAAPPFIVREGLPELSLEPGTIVGEKMLPLGLPQPVLHQGTMWGTVPGCGNAENSPGCADPSAG